MGFTNFVIKQKLPFKHYTYEVIENGSPTHKLLYQGLRINQSKVGITAEAFAVLTQFWLISQAINNGTFLNKNLKLLSEKLISEPCRETLD